MKGRWLWRSLVSMANMDCLSICSSCYFTYLAFFFFLVSILFCLLSGERSYDGESNALGHLPHISFLYVCIIVSACDGLLHYCWKYLDQRNRSKWLFGCLCSCSVNSEQMCSADAKPQHASKTKSWPHEYNDWWHLSAYQTQSYPPAHSVFKVKHLSMVSIVYGVLWCILC